MTSTKAIGMDQEVGILMLYDTRDPTMALFLTEGAASRAAGMVLRYFPDRVTKADPKAHYSRGELKGYKVHITTKDHRNFPLTNSDFERLH